MRAGSAITRGMAAGTAVMFIVRRRACTSASVITAAGVITVGAITVGAMGIAGILGTAGRVGAFRMGRAGVTIAAMATVTRTRFMAGMATATATMSIGRRSWCSSRRWCR